MSKVFQKQSLFFAFGVLCKLTVYDSDRFDTLRRAKARAQEIDRKSSGVPADIVIGYAAQEIKRIFIRDGISQAVIQLGGTVINVGRTRRIGIQNPFMSDNTNFAYLDVGEKAMVTLDRNALTDSLFSARSNYASVTLIGNDVVQLSKLCRTIMGYSLNNAFALLDGTECEAIFVTKDEQVLTTSGLSREQQVAA